MSIRMAPAWSCSALIQSVTEAGPLVTPNRSPPTVRTRRRRRAPELDKQNEPIDCDNVEFWGVSPAIRSREAASMKSQLIQQHFAAPRKPSEDATMIEMAPIQMFVFGFHDADQFTP